MGFYTSFPSRVGYLQSSQRTDAPSIAQMCAYSASTSAPQFLQGTGLLVQPLNAKIAAMMVTIMMNLRIVMSSFLIWAGKRCCLRGNLEYVR